MPNSSPYDPLFSQIASKTGTDPAQWKRAAQSGSIDDMLRALGPGDAKRVRSVLENKAELQRLIQSDAVQSMMKKLSEGR